MKKRAVKKLAIMSLLVVIFAVISCGVPPSQRPKNNQSLTGPTPEPVTTPVVTGVPTPAPTSPPIALHLFGAPWCIPCNDEIPEVNQRLQKEFAGLTERIAVTVNVEYGKDTQSPPTADVTEQWKQQLNVPFSFVNGEWKLKNYKKYFKLNDGLPATVIFGPSGVVIEKYVGNKHMDEIMAKLHELVKQGEK